MMMCAFVFYFAYSSHSMFKFQFEPKEFENIKGFIKRSVFYFKHWLWAETQLPASLASRAAQLGPPGTHTLTGLT
jgi:hypothetical protein